MRVTSEFYDVISRNDRPFALLAHSSVQELVITATCLTAAQIRRRS